MFIRRGVLPDGHDQRAKPCSDFASIRTGVCRIWRAFYSGHPALMETSVNAVKASNPFKQLPDFFPEDYLELTWTFIYSILR
jgi:hypothetical protein